MSAMKCSLILIAAVSAQLLFQSLITAAIVPSSLGGQRPSLHQQQSYQNQRILEDVDGITACSDCKSSEGQKCVGRTITDENCDNCSKGQAFWPCNLVKECWCWDTSLIRDPGDEDSGDIACSGCGRGGDNEICVANQNSLVPVGDEECNKCVTEGQSFWPCDDQDLCWCWDTTKPKKPPAPASGLSLAVELDPNVPTPCEILTRTKFDILAPNSTFPYTYEGLCNAIDDYNLFHTEKFAAMGTEEHIRAEFAAFLGNTAHESDDFEAGREYLACGDRKEVDGKVYCKPCNNDLYDWENNVCSVSMVDQNSPYNSYCQPSFEPPEGCVCETITQVAEDGPLAGYVEASKVFYGRGAIQLSWNYNYIRASYSLTGNATTFCEDPEMVATSPEYAWGAGIYFWMENQKEGSTCHKEALKGDFGGTLNNINGGLECPAYKGGWHADAIKMRLNRYCHAASQLGQTALLSLDGCKGMTESYEECLGDGHCKYCEQYAGIATKTFTNTGTDSVTSGSETDSRPTTEEEPKRTATPTPSPASALASSMPTPTPVSALTSMPTVNPTLTPAYILASSMPTPVFSITMANPSPTKSPSLKEASIVPTVNTISPSATSEGFKSSSPTTLKPSPPTLTPTTEQPSVSPHNSPTQEPTTSEPSYTPTTPQPTMGPCDGESCPGEMCRSAFGFCGGGSTYCSEQAIWSPECRANSDPPSPSPTTIITDEPTKSPVEKATPILDSIFSVTKAPISSGAEATVEPSKSPSVPAKGGAFAKPSGGKGGKPKPSAGSNSSPQTGDTAGKLPSTSSLQTADAAEKVVSTNSPTPSPSPAPTRKPVTATPTSKPAQKVYSPTDPEATYFCGTDWEDANNSCSIRCPSSKSDDCPSDQKCFAFTSCMDEPEEETSKPTDRPTNPPFTNAPNAPGIPTPAPTNEETKLDACTGAPCPFAGECRSQYGFCGTSFIYCNALSTWTLRNCGLAGIDENGDPVLCDAEVLTCPEGEEAYRNPSNECEYFPCPDEEDENAITSSAFQIPAASPTKFSELPKPTLPIIAKPAPNTLPSVNKPSTGMIDLGKKPTGSSNNTVVIVGTTDDIADDGEESTKKNGDEDDAKPLAKPETELALGSFSTGDWLSNSADLSHRVSLPWVLMISIVAITAI